MGYKEILDNAVNTARFKIDDCIGFETYLTANAKNNYDAITNKLTAKETKALKRSLVRNSFLIEPVNDEVTSTKVEVHWSDHLSGDVRFASYTTCEEIFYKLLETIANLSDEDFDLLREFFNSTVVPYEMPVDYIERYANPIHVPSNIALFLDDNIRKCIFMRRFIRDSQRNPASDVFQKILDDKIKVKTYLTDRALTGDYKTNREKRWEAHPNSVQYALRRDCMLIETKLLTQIATFEGCDATLVQNLQDNNLIPSPYEFCKCPITGENIKYDEFAQDALHPVHGKSKFQVGHLNPLKAGESEDETEASGHTANNISWISENGNRIQGSLSLAEVDNLLKMIIKNRPELTKE